MITARSPKKKITMVILTIPRFELFVGSSWRRERVPLVAIKTVGIKYQADQSGRVYGHFVRSFLGTIKKNPAKWQDLSAFSSAVCLVGMWLDSYALGPYGGLIPDHRHQHAGSDLIAQTHRLLQRVDVLRFVRLSTRPLTGRKTKPLILSQSYLTVPGIWTGRLPCRQDYNARRAIWQAFPCPYLLGGATKPRPTSKDVPPSPTAKTAGIIY